MKHSKFKKFCIILSITTLLIVSTGSVAMASENSKGYNHKKDVGPGVMVVDIAAARPVGFASLLVGTTFFAISLPFTLIGGNTGVAFDQLVKEPARYTFLRPLGSF